MMVLRVVIMCVAIVVLWIAIRRFIQGEPDKKEMRVLDGFPRESSNLMEYVRTIRLCQWIPADYDVSKRVEDVLLIVNISHQHAPRMTTNHESVSEYLRLEMSAGICCQDATKGGEWIAFGRILDSHLRLGGPKKLPRLVNLAMDIEDIKWIFEIWEQWEDHTLCQGCIHQEGLSRDLDSMGLEERSEFIQVQAARCPYRYVYGSAPLVRILPECVLKRLRSIMDPFEAITTNQMPEVR